MAASSRSHLLEFLGEQKLAATFGVTHSPSHPKRPRNHETWFDSQSRVSILRPMAAGFLPFALGHGRLAEAGPAEFASSLSAWRANCLELFDEGTHFGYVWQGRARLRAETGEFVLRPGMYFSLPGAGSIEGEGAGIVVTRTGFRGLFSLGGPIEPSGRLRYIDGCTDSLLIPPVLRGDACLNALYFPPGVDQTEHTHPTVRIGLVVSGRGECLTPAAQYALEPGLPFLIPAGELHRFRTQSEGMVVVAYHPDSDFGPTHEAHPMINRTIVNGVPASVLGALHTLPA